MATYIRWKGQVMELGEKEAVMVALQRVASAKRSFKSMVEEIEDILASIDCEGKHIIAETLDYDTGVVLRKLNTAIDMLKRLLPDDIADELSTDWYDTSNYIQILD